MKDNTKQDLMNAACELEEAITQVEMNALEREIAAQKTAQKTAIEIARKKLARDKAESEARESILLKLPANISRVPTISNINHRDGLRAWLSFSRPSYDPENSWNPVELLQQLEAGGWMQMPATLCKYGNWRPSVRVGLQGHQPEKSGGGELKTSWPMAPCWLTMNVHTGTDFHLFMSKEGQDFFISIDMPRQDHKLGLETRRREWRGGWDYSRVELRYPAAWHGIEHCTIHEKSAAYHPVQQAADGRIMFAPHMDQADWPAPASEFMSLLLEDLK